VARLKTQGISPTALSSCGLEAPYAPGLLIGFTNVDSSQAIQASQQFANSLS
jgi:hypothetical protein